MSEQQISAEQIKKKSRKGVIIVALVIIFALALGLAAGRYFGAADKTNDEPLAEEQTNQNKEQGVAIAPIDGQNPVTPASGQENNPSNNQPSGTGQNPSTTPNQNPPTPANPNPTQAPEPDRQTEPNITISYPKSNAEVGSTFDIIGHSKRYGESLSGIMMSVSVQTGGTAYYIGTISPYSPLGPGELEPGLWGDFNKTVTLSGSLVNGQALILYIFYYNPTKKEVTDTVSMLLKYKDPNAPPQMANPPGQQTAPPVMNPIITTTFNPILIPAQLP